MNGPLNYYRTAKFRHEEELGEFESLRNVPEHNSKYIL